MSGRRHVGGVCTCLTHLDRPWNRSEHWTADEVDYLETYFGGRTDAAIARHLGRSITGIRLKAKRLGVHKRTNAGLTARAVAATCGIDSGVVIKCWIARGLLPARRLTKGHRAAYWIVSYGAFEAFVREHPEHIDVDKMPDSPYRDLAAGDPWISLVAVHRLTGRGHSAVAALIGDGTIRGRRRGAHWFIPRADVALIRHLAPAAIAESVFRRDSVLEHRRNRRKGVAA